MRSEVAKLRVWSGVALTVLTLVWLLGTPYLFATGVMASWDRPFVDHERAARFKAAAGIVMVVAPVAATVIALQSSRKVATWLFGAGAALSLLIVLAFIGSD
ncbi:hypothetical protein [Streptosporangium sp. NPDC087985]|uniref:hypothetical protein n=1 Tax=Streptosporangium sp. NPDC087985 TaxID=3366196 RepID=UPI00382A5386